MSCRRRWRFPSSRPTASDGTSHGLTSPVERNQLSLKGWSNLTGNGWAYGYVHACALCVLVWVGGHPCVFVGVSMSMRVCWWGSMRAYCVYVHASVHLWVGGFERDECAWGLRGGGGWMWWMHASACLCMHPWLLWNEEPNMIYLNMYINARNITLSLPTRLHHT